MILQAVMFSCLYMCFYVFFLCVIDLSVVSVSFGSVLMFFTKNVSHSPTQAFGHCENTPGDVAPMLLLVSEHGLHWKSGTKVLHICMCMTFVFFCLHMRFLLSIVCVLCWSSEYCASPFYEHTGGMLGCCCSHGLQLFDGVQQRAAPNKAACGCLEVLAEIRSAKYLIVLQA